MPEYPPCANFLSGTCSQSEVFIVRETDDSWVFGCRTCRSINVFPKDSSEDKGKYDAWLKHKAAREAQTSYESSRPAFSLPSKEK